MAMPIMGMAMGDAWPALGLGWEWGPRDMFIFVDLSVCLDWMVTTSD